MFYFLFVTFDIVLDGWKLQWNGMYSMLLAFRKSCLCYWCHLTDLVKFTTGVPDMNNTSVTEAIPMRHESDTSKTGVTRFQQGCDTNNAIATRMKIFGFDTTRVKTYFHTPILAVCQMKDYKERNNFILRATIWKRTKKIKLCNGKSH